MAETIPKKRKSTFWPIVLFVGMSYAFLMLDITAIARSKAEMMGHANTAIMLQALPVILLFVTIILAFIRPGNNSRFAPVRIIGLFPVWLKAVILFILGNILMFVSIGLENKSIRIISFESKPDMSIVEKINTETPCKLVWHDNIIVFENDPRTNEDEIRAVFKKYNIELHK